MTHFAKKLVVAINHSKAFGLKKTLSAVEQQKIEDLKYKAWLNSASTQQNQIAAD